MTSQDDVKGEGFEVIGHQEPKAAADEKSEGAGEPTEPPVPLDVYTVLRVSIAQLESIAWQMMGLRPDPFTSQVRKDLDQARLAIDAATALVDKLTPHIQKTEAREYQTVLTNLRLNFVSHSGADQAQAEEKASV
ncbi:MAG: DUF1844 domain-containing protein [Armatimonadota bacterium]